MKLENARGMRDFSGSEMSKRKKVMKKLEDTFKLYGYEELETPIVERWDVLTYKYDQDSAITKEIFKLKDQGDRDLCLRYDLTVPFARFVSMNPTMKMPFKRYSIGKVYRDGPIKLGRTREFIQCDFDVVGSKSINAEIEILKIFFRFFKQIGLNVRIEINNIQFLKAIMNYFQVKDEEKVISILDKIKKVSTEQIEKELIETGLKKEQVEELFDKINLKDNNQIFEFLSEIVENQDEIKDMQELLEYFENEKLEFSLGLARGLSYYTGPVFEVFMAEGEFTSSLGSGGRYDNMIKQFCNKEIPAVGGSFGLEPIMVMLDEQNMKSNENKLYIIPIKNYKQSMKIAEQFREAGINTAIDISNKNVGKNMDYANSKGFEYVIIIGDKEIEAGRINLKNMESGEQTEVTVDQAIELLK